VFSLVRAAKGCGDGTEVNIQVRGGRQALMIGEFLTPIPCERAAQLPRQVLYLSGKSGHDTGGIFVLDPGQNHVADVTLDERDDVAVLGAGNQINFPVAGAPRQTRRYTPLNPMSLSCSAQSVGSVRARRMSYFALS
jgi:hypothetical protein